MNLRLKTILLLVLLESAFSFSYNVIATCKTCSKLSGCANNICVYFNGGPYTNYEDSCASN